MKNLIKIYTDSAINVNRMAEVLKDNGIASMIKDNNAAGSLAGFGTIANTVELFVEHDNLQSAQSILESLKR
jgi:hypothetical protein